MPEIDEVNAQQHKEKSHARMAQHQGVGRLRERIKGIVNEPSKPENKE